MLVSARDLVMRLPDADERQIRVGMSGNLCRCTGYVGIIRAVGSVIAARRARGIGGEAGGGRRCLGPVGSGRGRETGELVQPSVVQSARSAAPAVAPTIADFTPATSIAQSFEVAHPPKQVFALFGDVAAVASCLPGASLTRMDDPHHVE